MFPKSFDDTKTFNITFTNFPHALLAIPHYLEIINVATISSNERCLLYCSVDQDAIPLAHIGKTSTLNIVQFGGPLSIHKILYFVFWVNEHLCSIGSNFNMKANRYPLQMKNKKENAYEKRKIKLWEKLWNMTTLSMQATMYTRWIVYLVASSNTLPHNYCQRPMATLLQ